MPQRFASLLWSSVSLFLAVPVLAQTPALRLLDADHQPVSSVLEGSRLVIQVTTDGTGSTPASDTVTAQASAALTGDSETVVLTETAPDSRVFEGEILLATGAAVPGDGRLTTGRSGALFDTVSVVAGALSATAPTAGSGTALGGDVFPVGAALPLQVRDNAADTSAGADTTTVAVQGSGGDLETVTLTETGGHTGLFTGTLATARAAVSSGDGTLEAQPGETVTARHTDGGGAVSTATASLVRRTLEFIAVDGSPAGTVLERDFAQVRLFDRSGPVSDLTCQLTSALTGDTESLPLGGDAGIFWNSFPLAVVPPVPGDGLVSTSEGGAPDPRDVLTAQASCGDPEGCLTASIHTVDARIQFLDEHGQATAAVVAGRPLRLRVAMPKANTTQSPDTLVLPVQSGSDAKTVALTETGRETSTFEGTLATSTNPADLGDPARLVVQAGETVAVSTALASAAAQAVSGAIEFVDGSGAPVSTFFENGTVTVRALAPTADTTPGADLLPVEAVVARPHDAPFDRETLTLTEIGPSTGVFTATVPLAYAGGATAGDCTVATGVEPDLPQRLQVGFADHSATAAPVSSATRLVDAQGNDDDAYTIGDTVYVRVEDHRADNPGALDFVDVALTVPGSGDAETLTLAETGAHTGVFTGALPTQGAAPATPGDGSLQVHRGVSIRADYAAGTPGGSSDTATVQGNAAPRAVNDSATLAEDTAVTVNVAANDTDPDGDALTVIATGQGAHGSVVLGSGGTLTYRPAADYNGPDSFLYTVTDYQGGNATGTVQVTVTPVNDPPSAANDSAGTLEDTAVNISVLLNDSDRDGDPLTVAGVTPPAHGTAAVQGGGVIRYTPAPNYNGGDSFTYTASDGHGGTASATVSVSVAPVNDPPSAGNDSAVTRELASVTIPVLANDSDVDSPPAALTVTAVTQPAHGTAARLANNSVVYTPASGFKGVDTFTYTVSDGSASATGTVAVTVKDALERVAVLATNSAWLQASADVLSGDVIVNQAGTGPFLTGVELSIDGAVTTPAGWDVEANRLNIAAGAVLAGDVSFNQSVNNGAITGRKIPSLSLPVFAALPALQTAVPGPADVNVGPNGSQTLTPGSYRDLVVAKKATVTFTGGVYHFRSIRVADVQAKLLFSAPAEVRVQQKLSTAGSTTIAPNTGAAITAANIVFHVAGSNGTGGGIFETPRAVEIGTDNVLSANLYAPNGTLWLGDRTQARGAFLAKDVQAGPDVQVTLQTAWTGQ